MSERVTANFYERGDRMALTIWSDASGYVPAIGDYLVVLGPTGKRSYGVVSRTWQRGKGGIDCNLIVDPIEVIEAERDAR